MKLQGIKLLGKNAVNVISKNSPTILTGLGVVGLVSTTVMGIKVTPKALMLLEDESDHPRSVDELAKGYTKLEVVKICWKPYIPVVILGLTSIACIVGANTINLKRNAALLSLYTVANGNLKEYEGKIKELIGEKKNDDVKADILAERIAANQPSEGDIIYTGKGEVLCFEPYSGRYFKNEVENVRRIENSLNKALLDEDFVNLNDLYYELGLPEVKLGNDMGWTPNDGLLELRLSSTLMADNQPCLAIDWNRTPDFFK